MGVLARGTRRPAARREGEEAAGRVEERSRRRRRPCSGSGSSSRPPASGTRCACPSSAGTSGAGFVSGAKADFFLLDVSVLDGSCASDDFGRLQNLMLLCSKL
jgi:hypothetical protein